MTKSSRRNLRLVVALCAVLMGLLVYGLVATVIDLKSRPAAAPAFSLEVLELGTPSAAMEPLIERAGSDGRITLRELRGTPVVLNFWASWCEYCHAETPLLEATSKRAAADGVVFLGVDTKDVRDDARAFLSEYEVTYPNVSDVDEATADRYGATALPATFFINARGEVVDQFIGELSPDDLEAGVRAARNGSPP